MALSAYFTRKPEFELFAMGPADLGDVSALHRRRFTPAWSDGAIHALLVQKTVFGFVARQTNAGGRRPMAGFVLARAAPGEAEILTVAVDQRFSRLGLAWRLMRAAIREARDRDASAMFLEVDEANVAAVALYHKLGFRKVGERRAYYQDVDGRRTAALVMRLDFA